MDERKFALALLVSATLHMGLLPALFLFATGTAPRPVRPFAEGHIQAFLVPETFGPAGRTATQPRRERRGGERIPPAAAPTGAVLETAVTGETRGETVHREALRKAAPEESVDGKLRAEDRTPQPLAEGLARGGDGIEFPDPSLSTLPARASAVPDAGGRRSSAPSAGRGEGEGSRRTRTEDVAPLPLDADAVPRYRENARPAYPPLARIRGYQGVVVLRVEVLADGRVGQVGIRRSAGHEILDRTALEAVLTWKFDPGRRGGRAVAMSVEVPVRFVLNGHAAQ